MHIAAQVLLEKAQSLFNLTQGELAMFFMDVPPSVPSQFVPVVIAEVSQLKATNNSSRTIGVCRLVENPIQVLRDGSYSAANSIGPEVAAESYLMMTEKLEVDISTAQVTLLKGPEHGTIIMDERSGRIYLPEPNYFGTDHATFLVKIDGKEIKVEYFIQVVAVADDILLEDPKYCPNGERWLISLNPGDPTAPIYTIQNPNQLISGYSVLADVKLSFADLPAGTLGQSIGSSITLDTNAAGNGWFIDASPLDNSEFLPTSNPYEWVAKEGSAAYGKMDMLSVLLHEYGHALGIDHSADGHDYMATTLTAGVRRLPSAEELALMQQLVSGIKTEMASVTTRDSNSPSQLPLLPLGGFGLAFLGRLRGTRYGSLNVEADLSTLVTQFAVTANAKLTNGNFSVASGMPVDNGWATQGSVDFTPATGSGQSGSATLKETTTSQARL